MRKIIWSMPVSLDGYFEGPHGLDWVLADAELHDYATAEFDTADTMLFGRVTFELFVSYWPTAAAQPDMPDYMVRYANAINRESVAKYVFSKTLANAGWNATIVRDIVPADIERMKQGPGKDMLIAGGAIGSEFARLGLIDEYEVLIHPVVLGGGKRLFANISQRLNLNLLKTQTFRSGVQVLRYARA